MTWLTVYRRRLVFLVNWQTLYFVFHSEKKNTRKITKNNWKWKALQSWCVKIVWTCTLTMMSFFVLAPRTDFLALPKLQMNLKNKKSNSANNFYSKWCVQFSLRGYVFVKSYFVLTYCFEFFFLFIVTKMKRNDSHQLNFNVQRKFGCGHLKWRKHSFQFFIDSIYLILFCFAFSFSSFTQHILNVHKRF